ncbi:MAG TPA: hemolysin family protein [Gelidibacter sp.]|uniref:hemolysin family protein n=1 Tax=Gelidibacter sp. TaxID=2018083 RepID=UPI002BC8AD6E|nr:hemolysin family protein [Gelidibacter sp.]HXJ97328.1 hemolysin family protein [Gelidibacter sp.]
MEILIIIGLVLLNGIFAMSEMSLVSSRKFKLENAKKKGIKGAKVALELSENPTKFLSTVQIGITLIGILLGVYSGENLTSKVTLFLSQFEVIKPYASNIATGIIVVSITYLSIVLGELLPKRLGMTFPEPIAILLAKPMKILSAITSPFVWLLTASNDILIKILGIKNTTGGNVSEEEIKSIIKESAKEGEILDIEHNIMERVFELGDRKVDTLFTHRNDIVFFTTSDSWEDIKSKINQEKHSAYPVSKTDNLDDILGIVLLKDLFTPSNDKKFNIKDFIKQPIYFNESVLAYKVLEMFKKEKMHYGIVVDEYGTTQGIVTMDDVVDALVGESTENDQHEYQLTQRDENSWLVDGQYSIIEFIKYFDLDLEENYQSSYTTVAGLIIYSKSIMPEVGQKIMVGNYELEIIDKDGQRIDKILVTRKDQPS